jgi:hypothetical protein
MVGNNEGEYSKKNKNKKKGVSVLCGYFTSGFVVLSGYFTFASSRQISSWRLLVLSGLGFRVGLR